MNMFDIAILIIVLIASMYIVYTICDTIVKVKKIEYDYMNKRFLGITEGREDEEVSDVEA